MKDYGALLTRLRAGAVLRDQWDAVLADIRGEDTAYVGEAAPLYYIGPHTAFIFEGKVYDATRGFMVRDDGTGTMRLIEDSEQVDAPPPAREHLSLVRGDPTALAMHLQRLRDSHLKDIQDALTAGNTAEDLVTHLRGTIIAMAEAIELLRDRITRVEERLTRADAGKEALPKGGVVPK